MSGEPRRRTPGRRGPRVRGRHPLHAAAGAAAARGGGLRVGGYIVGALFSVISASLLTRHLGVVQFGEYVTALSLVAIVGALSDLGLTAVGVRELSMRPPAERWSLARDLLGTADHAHARRQRRDRRDRLGSPTRRRSPPVSRWRASACCCRRPRTTSRCRCSSACGSARSPRWNSRASCSRPLFTIVLVFAGATLVPFLGVSIPVGADRARRDGRCSCAARAR